MSRKTLKIVGNIIFVTVIIIVLSLVIIEKKHSRIEEVDELKLVEIPITDEIPEGETRIYIISECAVELSKSTAETVNDVVNDINENNENKLWQEDVYENDDGTITLILNNNQLKQWVKSTEEIINDTVEENIDKMDIMIDNDFKKITYYIYPECSSLEWMAVANKLALNMNKAQMFLSKSTQEYKIQILVVGMRTNETICDFYMPGNEFHISKEEWNAKVNGEADETE